MNRIASFSVAAAFVVGVVSFSATCADAALKKYILGDHPDGSLDDYNPNYGLRWDDAPGGRKVFSFQLDDALVKMHIDVDNNSATIFGTMQELTNTGVGTGNYWDLSWTMTGLDIDSGIEKYFELDLASNALGTLYDGTNTYDIFGKYNSNLGYAFIFEAVHRNAGPAGAGWFTDEDMTYGNYNDFLFTATLDTSDDPPAVPVPAALPLFLTAMAGLGFVGYRRRSQSA